MTTAAAFNRKTLQVLLAACLTGVAVLPGPQGTLYAQSKGWGPEIKSFLEYIRHEQVELDFQIAHNEISRKEYVRSKNRLEVHRDAVLTNAKRTGQDLVPEYTVMTAGELTDILPNGVDDLRGHKPGDAINKTWRYAGYAVRGEKFYIMERLPEG